MEMSWVSAYYTTLINDLMDRYWFTQAIYKRLIYKSSQHDFPGDLFSLLIILLTNKKQIVILMVKFHDEQI